MMNNNVIINNYNNKKNERNNNFIIPIILFKIPVNIDDFIQYNYEIQWYMCG